MSEAFVKALKDEANYSITENGALGYATTTHEALDFFYKVSSYRNKSENEIIEDFKKVLDESLKVAIQLLFYIRDCRGGLGERRLFKLCLPVLVERLKSINKAKTTVSVEEVVDKLVDMTIQYGRFDDIYPLLDTEFEQQIFNKLYVQFNDDLTIVYDSSSKHLPISLLGKWLPSVNTSSNATRSLARRFCKAFDMTERQYRKSLSLLRKYLDVVEVKTSSNQWSEIKYETVPSKANIKYKDAFMKHDSERRTDFLSKVNKGEAKINAGVLYPHDIVSSYRNNRSTGLDESLETMWKNLKDTVKGQGNFMVVRDGSGSMCWSSNLQNTCPLDIATALAIYYSERGNEVYKDKFITFSETPRFVDLSSCKTLLEKLRKCYRETECANTNIELTMKLVLDTAVKNHLSQEDIPDLLIISDMEFDCAISYSERNNRLFETIGKMYAEKGYKLPRLIFWNVASRTGTIPVKENENGVVLVSGFSSNVTDMIISNELDPFKNLLNKLDKDYKLSDLVLTYISQ